VLPAKLQSGRRVFSLPDHGQVEMLPADLGKQAPEHRLVLDDDDLHL